MFEYANICLISIGYCVLVVRVRVLVNIRVFHGFANKLPVALNIQLRPVIRDEFCPAIFCPEKMESTHVTIGLGGASIKHVTGVIGIWMETW